MARYIDMNELLNAIDKRNGGLPSWLDEILVVDCKVADVVPVVRCKDCTNHGHCVVEDGFVLARLNDDRRFCGAGKAKMDEEVNE